MPVLRHHAERVGAPPSVCAAAAAVICHQSPSGYRLTTRILLWIMNRPAGFSATTAANTARATASVRQIASFSLRLKAGRAVV
jgi:hypothetical protein